MLKFIFSFLSLVMVSQVSMAQKRELVIRSSDKGLYLDHKVAAKESFYSIGRLYNVHPRHIASFNKLDMNKGLLIDQKIRIPLSDTNFTQKGNSGTPVYYKVADDLSLMKVSKDNNDVLLVNLRGWNNLANDNVKKDAKLIVGFLQSKEMPAVTIAMRSVVEEPLPKKEEKELKDEKKAEEKALEKLEEKPPVETKAIEKAVYKPETGSTADGEGYFKLNFEQQTKKIPVSKDATVTAGIFKTTSGWQDAKYYLLIDGVSPGTIIKVINPTNNKAIYAKVLGEMSGIRQNEGLSIRISNAAASVLQINEQDKFIVKVNY